MFIGLPPKRRRNYTAFSTVPRLYYTPEVTEVTEQDSENSYEGFSVYSVYSVYSVVIVLPEAHYRWFSMAPLSVRQQ